MTTSLRGGNDAPIQNSEDDHLGFQVYVDALKEFILGCETPMTVAIQGDWGSGKTSLMNLLRSKLTAEDSAKKIQCAWINTWQFSQFDLGAELPFSVISLFSRQLAGEQPAADILRTIGNMAWRVGKGAAMLATAKIATADTAEAMSKLISASSDDAVDNTQRIDNMRTGLQEMINKARKAKSIDRFVVFVDDIDRLVPTRAVELLEVMKVFLDIEGCIFVLACDYQVVSSGLRAKFGQDGSELKGRHFFDKIIQLPFSMPGAQLDIATYLQRRLEACGIALGTLDRSELSLYEGLLSTSVGFNPRSLKRLSNCLHVLRIVADKKGILAPVEGEGNRKERERALFAALCLQTAYEPVYSALIEIAAGGWEGVLSAISFIAGTDSGTQNPSTGKPVADARISKALKLCEKEHSGAATSLIAFAAALHRALQIETGKSSQLETTEISMFVGMLRFSSITATVSSPQQSRVRIDLSAASNIIRALQPKLREYAHKTAFADGDGCWVSPIIAGLGFLPYLGFFKSGALAISIDIATDSDAVIENARANAREWAQAYFRKLPQFANKIQMKKSNAQYGAVIVELEPDGFANQPEAELRSKVAEYADKVYLPFVKHLIACQSHFRQSKARQ